MPRHVQIVTDSAADLPLDIVLQRNIRVVPLYVTLDNTTLRDGVELPADELYRKMKEDKAVPRTSQPSPEDFKQVFEMCPEQALCVTLSSNLSGTLQSADLSKQLISQPSKITTYDSKNASLGEGIKVLIADDLAEQGHDISHIVSVLDNLKLRTVFTVDQMQYLERGGRVSKAQAAMATVLDIKPILTMSEEGRIESETKVRGRQKSLRYLLDQLTAEVASDYDGYIGLSYAYCPEEAGKLVQTICAKFPKAKVITGSIGAVIGSHTGPGCMALFFEIR